MKRKTGNRKKKERFETVIGQKNQVYRMYYSTCEYTVLPIFSNFFSPVDKRVRGKNDGIRVFRILRRSVKLLG